MNAKVRCVIVCAECRKPRCVYSHSKPSATVLLAIKRIKESKVYTCGGSLFPEASPCLDTVVVREALVCNSPIEVQYYKSTLVSFPGICYYCGMGAETLIDDSEIQELRESYATVLPICFLCKSEGKKIICRQPSNIPKRPRKEK